MINYLFKFLFCRKKKLKTTIYAHKICSKKIGYQFICIKNQLNIYEDYNIRFRYLFQGFKNCLKNIHQISHAEDYFIQILHNWKTRNQYKKLCYVHGKYLKSDVKMLFRNWDHGNYSLNQFLLKLSPTSEKNYFKHNKIIFILFFFFILHVTLNNLLFCISDFNPTRLSHLLLLHMTNLRQTNLFWWITKEISTDKQCSSTILYVNKMNECEMKKSFKISSTIGKSVFFFK